MTPVSLMSATSRRNKIGITAGYYAALFCIGLSASIIGPTLPGLAENTGADIRQISLLFTARSLGILVGALTVSRLYDRLPGHPVLVIGLLSVALTLALVPLASQLWGLVVVMLLMGLVGSVIDVGTNTMLPWLHRGNVAPYMNGLHFFFGVGAFLAPIGVAQSLLMSGDIVWAYWLLALLIVPAAAWIALQPGPRPPTTRTSESAKRQNYPLVAAITCFFFLYVGTEVSFGGWIYTYAVQMGLASVTTAAYLTSLFWGALTVGRLISIPAANRMAPRRLLAAGIVGCLVSMGLLLTQAQSTAVLWISSMGMGLSMAPLFPTTLSLAERNMPVSAKTTGWFFAGVSLGAMTLPWLVGQLFDGRGPVMAMGAIGGGVLGTAVLYGVMLLVLRRKIGSEQPHSSSGKRRRE
jgi:MFS transporter, FHS family, Na+ dependent glucose transporter 1